MNYIWLGQRISDGILYSKALPDIKAFFTCDFINASFPDGVEPYYLFNETGEEVNWHYYDISTVVGVYESIIHEKIAIGHQLLSYYLSNQDQRLLKCETCLNHKIFNIQMPRSFMYYILKEHNVNVPNYLVPDNLSWESITKQLGPKVVVQYDKSSSGAGTFLVESSTEYDHLKLKMKRSPDIAISYISNAVSCSSHIYIASEGIHIFSSSIQIIEVVEDEKKYKCFSYKGNDFGLFHSSFGNDKITIDFVNHIGRICQKLGMRGLIGIDFMRTEEGVYFTEMNFRLQNSTALLSFLQESNGNILHYITNESYSKIPYEIEGGWQYYCDLKIRPIASGYYNLVNGSLVTDDLWDYQKLKQGNVLVFCGNNKFINRVRIIGLGACCLTDFNSNNKLLIENWLAKFIHMMVQRYGSHGN